MKIIFMGTPNFAVPSLEKLINDKFFEIIGVYTKEPAISGRGQKINKTPIHKLAEKNNLKIFTPKTLKNEDTQKEFQNLNADAVLVVAYGLILPKEILEGTKFGCFNIHPSNLPKWRGAAPIQRTIMNGDKETAICIIKMNEGLDSGDIVSKKNYSLNDDENYEFLEKKFAEIGSDLAIETFKNIENLKFEKQNNDLATYAKKLEKSECEIDFSKSAKEILRQIKGLSGNLGAFFNYDDEKIKILDAQIFDDEFENSDFGKIIDENFTISCQKGFLKPIILQRQGKKKMELKEILLGFKPEIGKKLNII
jgi:methionyl-tRNA formyltransferase